MIDLILLVPIVVSFLIVMFLTPIWIKKAQQIKLVWKDMNKIGVEKVSGSGGIIVLIAFFISSLIYVAYLTFYRNNNEHLIAILALLLLITLVGGIGFIDDLLGWQKGGLSRRSRLILVALTAIPLMAIKAGDSNVGLPFLGALDLGIFYPLILIPFGIIGATTTFNFLAGFNGLEAGNGVLLLSGAAIAAYLTGNVWITVVLLCMVGALFAFLKFNFSPAKVLPGDVLTYPVGALFAGAAILGNFEKIAVAFFIPVIIEVILKSRGKLIKSSFGEPQKDGTLTMKYDKVYGLTHLGIYILTKLHIPATEKKVVYMIWGFQALVIIAALLFFREGLHV